MDTFCSVVFSSVIFVLEVLDFFVVINLFTMSLTEVLQKNKDKYIRGLSRRYPAMQYQKQTHLLKKI